MTPSDIAELIRSIAPADFPESQPIYICFASELPRDLRPVSCLGYTGVRLDIALRGWLLDVGRWQGRGPAVVVNDVEMILECDNLAENDTALFDELLRCRLLAVAWHEFAHVLTHPIDLRPIPDEIAEDLGRKAQALTSAWVTGERTLPAAAAAARPTNR